MKLPEELDTDNRDDRLYNILCIIIDIIYALLVVLVILIGSYILISDLQQYDINHGVLNAIVIIDK